jgi:hypothetical protein
MGFLHFPKNQFDSGSTTDDNRGCLNNKEGISNWFDGFTDTHNRPFFRLWS